jgi:hypothetical protein
MADHYVFDSTTGRFTDWKLSKKSPHHSGALLFYDLASPYGDAAPHLHSFREVCPSRSRAIEKEIECVNEGITYARREMKELHANLRRMKESVKMMQSLSRDHQAVEALMEL